MKTFFLVALLILAQNNISFGFVDLELYHQQNESYGSFLENHCLEQESSIIQINGFNFHLFPKNTLNGNFYQRYRIFFLTLSLILIGIFFGAFYPRMTQPPKKK